MLFSTPGGRRAAALILTTAALTTSLAACGTKKDTPSSGTSAPAAVVDSALAAKVPASVSADGKILVGSDTTYAPSEFLDTDGKTALLQRREHAPHVVGFDVDVFKLVAGKLGLKAEFQTATFGDIITGVNSGKYEVGVSSFTINDERKTQVNMVSYYSAGTQWLTKKGNPAAVKPDAACGKKIAVQKDTVQSDDATARSKKCTDAGSAAITVDPYPGQDQATAAVVSGKDDALLADSPVCAYAAKQSNGQLELLGDIYESAPYGYAIKKDQTAFAEAIRDALKALIADGSYAKALEKWGVQAGAISSPALNP